MSSEENEFLIPFDESRKGREPDLEEKALGRRLASYASNRLSGIPSLGRRRGGRSQGDIDLPTGGKPGTRKPTGSRRDPDGDGWADEGTTKPIYVGTASEGKKPKQGTEVSKLSSGKETSINFKKGWLKDSGTVWATDEETGKVTGALSFIGNYIQRVYVRPDSRRKGIAASLYNEAKKYNGGVEMRSDDYSELGAQFMSAMTGREIFQQGDVSVAGGEWKEWLNELEKESPSDRLSFVSQGMILDRLSSGGAFSSGMEQLSPLNLHDYGDIFASKKVKNKDTEYRIIVTQNGDVVSYLESDIEKERNSLAKTFDEQGENPFNKKKSPIGPNDVDDQDVLRSLTGKGTAPVIARMSVWAPNDGQLEVLEIQTRRGHRRRGIAAEMFYTQREAFPEFNLQHSNALSDDGRAFAEATPANRPLNGLLNTISNLHEFYNLDKNTSIDFEDREISSVDGGSDAFSSGANYETEVERQKLDGKKLTNAFDTRDMIVNFVLPSIQWRSGKLFTPENKNIEQPERFSYLEFADDDSLKDNFLQSLNKLFNNISIPLRNDVVVESSSGERFNLGSELLIDVSRSNIFAQEELPLSSQVSSVDYGASVVASGESLPVYVDVKLSFPQENVAGTNVQELSDVGTASFKLSITNTGLSVDLNQIFVKPELRNSGISTSFMAYSENIWKALEVDSISLTGRSDIVKDSPFGDAYSSNGATYWGINGFEWNGADSRSKMVGALHRQLLAENNDTATKKYFTKTEREQLLSGYYTENGMTYSSFKNPEEMLSKANKESLSTFFSELNNGNGIEVGYRRVIDKERYQKNQDLRLKLLLDRLPASVVDEWSTSEMNSRNAATKNKLPLASGDISPIKFLSSAVKDHDNKFSSGQKVTIEIERLGKDKPFDDPVGFNVGGKRFTLSHGGDSPGRDQYNGYLAAFDESGKLAGYIDYNSESIDSTAVVAMIEVGEDFKRMGIGSALLDALRISMPTYEISAGGTTDDGDKWWKAATGGTGPVKGPRRSALINVTDRRFDSKLGSDRFSSGTSDVPFSKDEDYRGFHQAPDRNSGAPMHNIADGMYPEEVYGPNGAALYASTDPLAPEALRIIKQIKGKPEALVTVYRAVPLLPNERIKELETQKSHILQYGRVPKYVSADISDINEYYDEISREIEMLRNAKHIDKNLKINAGDWVSPLRSYAKLHGDSNLGGKGKYRIVSQRVKAKHLFTEGNSLLEFGYDPDDNPRRLSSGEVKMPSFPREPSYGPFIGEADFIFGEAKTWRELREIFNNRDIIFIDYETTGIDFDRFRERASNGKPVEIALVKMRGGKVIDKLNLFMNPTEPLREWSRLNLYRTDGEPLTDEWLAQQMSIQDAHRMVAEFAGPGAIMGVQNAIFDKNVLEDALAEAGIMWRPSGYIDSLDMAQMVLPKYSEENKDGPSVIRGDTRVASTTLSALAEYLEVRLDRHHSAEQDATAAGMVMHAMINQAESRGWDNRILDRAQREDFLDERTKNFQTAREEFDAAKRRFINFESETARFSSGDDDRPILDVGIPPAKPDRDRPIIKIDPLLKPLRRDELEQLKRHQSMDYRYGQITEMGVELRISTPGFLQGLSSSQIANLMVPSSEDEYMEIIFDLFPIPPSNWASPEEIRTLMRKLILELLKSRKTEIDFSPQNVNLLRKAVEASLDASPELKWLMETFGSPPIVKNIQTDDSLSAAWLDQLIPTLNIVAAWEAIETGRTSQGEIDLTSEFSIGSTTVMDRSISAVFKHELVHYIHMRAMIEAELGGVFATNPAALPYRDLKATGRQYIRDYGTAEGRAARYRGLRVAEEYYSFEPLIDQQSIQKSTLAKDPNGAGFDERWLNLPFASTAHSYGNTNLVEALAEGAVAVLHPDPTAQERWITKKLRDDARAFLGLRDGETPWKEIEERDRLIKRTSIGTNLRSAARDRIDVARSQIRKVIDMRLSSGAERQRRIPQNTNQSSSSKLRLVNNPKGRDRSGPASSLAMEMLGPNRREILKNEDLRFSSGGPAQVYPAGAFNKQTQKTLLSNVYQDRNGKDVRMRGEVHAIGNDKIYFGHIPEKIKSQITDKEIKIIPLNPYLISGLSPTSAEGRDTAIRWIAARAARYESSGDQASTYVDALLYAGMRGDADSMLEFEDLAKKGELLIEEKRRMLTDGQGLSPAQIKYFQASADEKGIGNLSIDDLYVVHETTYDIVKDEAGNVLLRPAGDYGYIPTEDGGVYKHHRQTIHFTLNHLARGHSFRERKSKSNIIVTPLRSVIEDNPGALENLFVIDSWFVPEPEKPLVLRGATILENNESSENVDEELRQLLLSFGTNSFDGGETGGSSSNDHQDFKVGQIAAELTVTAMGHYDSTPRMIEKVTDEEDTARSLIVDPISWAVFSDNHRARIANTSDRFITHDEYEEGSAERRNFASGSDRRIDEITGRTVGGVYLGPRDRIVLRRPSKRSGVSTRQRNSFREQRMRLSSGANDIDRIGTVSKDPVAEVKGKIYARPDRNETTDTLVPVHDINGKQIAFTRDSIDAPGVLRLPVNPYVISNTSPKSKEGREFARLWFMATVAQVDEDRSRESRTSALLYAAARGDRDALAELERLSAVAEKIFTDRRENFFSSSPRYSLGGVRPEDRDDAWWVNNYRAGDITVTTEKDQYESKTRILKFDDLFLVHETVHKPQIDKDGNLRIYPNGDYDVVNQDTQQVVINPYTGEPLSTNRHSVHFSLNHLVQGHLYRPSAQGKSYAIVSQMKKVNEDNPGSLENLYVVDSYLTPPPEDGILFSAGTYRVIELPAVADYSKVEKPEGLQYEWTPEQQQVWESAFAETMKERQRLVNEALGEAGVQATGNSKYVTPILPGGEDGSKENIDLKMRDIAFDLRVESRPHSGSTQLKLESITAFTSDPQIKDIFRIGEDDRLQQDTLLYLLSENAILRIANNDRFSTSRNDYSSLVDESGQNAFFSGGEISSNINEIVDPDSARSQIRSAGTGPERISIPEAWFKDEFPMSVMIARFPNMHFRKESGYGNQYRYVPTSGELDSSADALDKLNDRNRMSNFLIRSHWHPGIVPSDTELGDTLNLWRSSFAESRKIARRLFDGAGSLENSPEEAAIDRAAEIIRNGLESAPPIGHRTYRVARLTPDVGSVVNIGEELNFRAAAVASGINDAIKYEYDELSAIRSIPEKFIFEFPDDTRGIFFDEQGLSARGKPSAEGGNYGIVEGIVSGKFKVSGIEKRQIKNPYSKRMMDRDVVILEKISDSFSSGEEAKQSQYMIEDDNGRIFFKPGASPKLTPLKTNSGRVTSLTSDINSDTLEDIRKITRQEDIDMGVPSPPVAKAFIAKNISRQMDVSLREIVDAFVEKGRAKPVIKNFISDDPKDFEKLHFITDGDNFRTAVEILLDVENGGPGKFLLNMQGARSLELTGFLQIDNYEKNIDEVINLNLEKRKELHEIFVQPIMDIGRDEFEKRVEGHFDSWEIKNLFLDPEDPFADEELLPSQMESLRDMAKIYSVISGNPEKVDAKLIDSLKENFEKFPKFFNQLKALMQRNAQIADRYDREQAYRMKPEKFWGQFIDGELPLKGTPFPLIDNRYNLDGFLDEETFTKSYFGKKIISKDSPDFENILKEQIVAELIHTWAISANDENPVSLALQHVARGMFSLDEAVGWQINPSQATLKSQSYALSLSAPGPLRALAEEDIISNESKKYDSAPELTPSQLKVLQEFISSMHQSTQEYYKSKGITHVPVYRGSTMTAEQSGYDSRRIMNTPEINEPTVFEASIESRPLSSWCTDRNVAIEFSRLSMDSDKLSHIYFTYIPIEEILANPFTGVGCLTESEIVVLGKKRKAIVAQVHEPGDSPSAIAAKLADIESKFITGDADWGTYDFPEARLSSGSDEYSGSGKRENTGRNRFKSGEIYSHIKNTNARAIAGLGLEEGKKSVDADFRKPTNSLEVAKNEGRPLSWLLNETIDPEIGESMGELIDELLNNKDFKFYFKYNQIHPYASVRTPDITGEVRRQLLISKIKMLEILQRKYSDLREFEADIIANGLLQRATTIATRTLWAEREAKELGVTVSSLIEKMINQTRRLTDYYFQLTDSDFVPKTFGTMRRGPFKEDRVVIALDMDALEEIFDGIGDDRRILSQFEAGRSNGAYDPGYRAAQEVSMFGYHPSMEPRLRPIYGFATYGGIGEEMEDIGLGYGQFLVVLKPSVNSRSTVSEVDSLSTMASASSFNAPGFGMRAMSDQYIDLDDDIFGGEIKTAVDYIEAQVHPGNGKSGVTKDDIAYILLRDDDEISAEQQLEMQEKLGVPVRRFEEEISLSDQDYNSGVVYIDESNFLE